MNEIRCEVCGSNLTNRAPIGTTKFKNGTIYDVYKCFMCDYINYAEHAEPLSYDAAIIKIADFYGADFQIIKAIKELVECADALGHFDEGKVEEDAVFDEIADCEIMFDQLRYLLSTHDSARVKIEAIKKAKIERQLKRIAEGEV